MLIIIVYYWLISYFHFSSDNVKTLEHFISTSLSTF